MADIGEPVRRITVVPIRAPVKAPEPVTPRPQKSPVPEKRPTAPERV